MKTLERIANEVLAALLIVLFCLGVLVGFALLCVLSLAHLAYRAAIPILIAIAIFLGARALGAQERTTGPDNAQAEMSVVAYVMEALDPMQAPKTGIEYRQEIITVREKDGTTRQLVHTFTPTL